MFPSVKLCVCSPVCVCVCVFSSVTLSCQLLECLTFDKAQVSLKTEQPSGKSERSCSFLVCSLSFVHCLVSLFLPLTISLPPSVTYTNTYVADKQENRELCKSSSPHILHNFATAGQISTLASVWTRTF